MPNRTLETHFTKGKIPGSGIRAVLEEVRGRRDVIPMHSGDPAHEPPASVANAVAGLTGRRQVYGPGSGVATLREKIAERLATVSGIEIGAGRVLISHGATQACHALFQALLKPGDEVLIPGIAWPNYKILAASVSAKAVPYRLNAHLDIDWDHLTNAFTERTRILIATNPSNPTGTIWNRDIVARLLDVASQNDCLLVSDEAYQDLWFDEAPTSPLTMPSGGEAVGLFSFSKAFAMTGWRVGYAVGPEWVIDRMVRIQESGLGGVSPVNQAAAEAGLASPPGYYEQMRDFYRTRAMLAVGILEELIVSKPAGGMFVFPRITSGSSVAAAQALLAHGVAVVPGSLFGEQGEGHLRISLAIENTDRLIKGLETVAQWSRKNAGKALSA